MMNRPTPSYFDKQKNSPGPMVRQLADFRTEENQKINISDNS